VDALHRLHQSSPAELEARLEAERRGIPFLVLRDAGQRQRIFELTADRSPLTIGRQPASDVALVWDDEVSRTHADVECIGDVWTLVDDGRSRNGSFVNGERVVGRRPLRHGEIVVIGRTRLTYVAPLTDGDQSTAVGPRATPSLSAAQRRVLVALCRPFAGTRFATPPSNREIAAELCVSIETVKFHLRALFDAFGLAGVPQHRKRAALAPRARVRRRDSARPDRVAGTIPFACCHAVPPV
jgi:pSer/pThr/pTyr-binding forkhead associated (FHA) protein